MVIGLGRIRLFGGVVQGAAQACGAGLAEVIPIPLALQEQEQALFLLLHEALRFCLSSPCSSHG